MAIPTGIAGQVGVKTETTHGTAVTVDRFYEFNSESIEGDIGRLESQGIRAGNRILRSDRWAVGAKTVGGDLEMELHSKSMGLWLQHMFGSIAITTPDGGTLSRDHTATPGDLPAGLTVQVGRPDESGTVRPYTYEGCVVESWELSAKTDEIGMLKVTLNGEDWTTATALATASYPTDTQLLTFVGATLSIAGSAVDCTELTLTGSNSLKTDRTKIGSQVRRQPVEADRREYGGEAGLYFPDLTAYNRFVNGTEAALVALWRGSLIEGSLYYQLEVTCNVRFDKPSGPNVSGPDELMVSMPFKCLDTGAGAGSAITAVYRTTDTVS